MSRLVELPTTLWLEDMRSQELDILAMERRIVQLEAIVTRLADSYACDRYARRLEKCKSDYDLQVELLCDKEDIFERVTSDMPDQLRMALDWHYRGLITWEKIARKLKISQRKMYMVAKDARMLFDDLYNKL